MALFAVRQVACRDTGFSPHELVFGKIMRGPLDLLYAGWVDECYDGMDVSSWVVGLQDTLHEVAVVNASAATDASRSAFNKHKSVRELEVGGKVLLRVPGLCGSLEASWEGPYDVVERLSRVNYKVCKGGVGRKRVVHSNITKRYVPRPVNVNAACVVAEEDKEMHSMWHGKSVLKDEKSDGYDEESLCRALSKLEDCFSDCPGLCVVCECSIVVTEGCEVVNLPLTLVPVNFRSAVNEEIKKLLMEELL